MKVIGTKREDNKYHSISQVLKQLSRPNLLGKKKELSSTSSKIESGTMS
jgi:hypothetical protein